MLFKRKTGPWKLNENGNIYNSLTPELREVEESDVNSIALEEYNNGYNNGFKECLVLVGIGAIIGATAKVCFEVVKYQKNNHKANDKDKA